MPRLIDADALMEQMKRRKEFVGRPSDPVCLVEDAPTIDAVPVVRCEECCYWRPPTNAEQEDGSTVGHCTAALNGQQTDAYWFCADGAR